MGAIGNHRSRRIRGTPEYRSGDVNGPPVLSHPICCAYDLLGFCAARKDQYLEAQAHDFAQTEAERNSRWGRRELSVNKKILLIP